MIAVAALPRLASEVLGLDDREVRAVVVDDSAAGESFVLRSVAVLVDATAAARAEGVRPGMRVLDAQQQAPSLAVDVVTAARLHAELRVVAEVLLACSPVVEPVPPCAVALDLYGMVRPLPRLLEDARRACARLGHRAVLVASPGTALSLALARAIPDDANGAVIVDDVPRALARLPVGALALPADLASSLRALGAVTAGDLARLLPRGGVERLGEDAGAVLSVLDARRTPLHGIEAPARVVEDVDLDHPVSAVEPLGFLLNRLCSRLAIRVRARRQRVAELTLTLAVFRRRTPPSVLRVAFPDPLVDDKAMLRALVVRLERHPLQEPVDRIALEVTRLASRAPRQLSLLDLDGRGTDVRAEEALAGLLGEMSAELGADRVGCLVVTDAPLPEHMTRLAWPPPPPPPRPPAPERRRPRKTAPLPPDRSTSAGRFLAGWPWPLRLLPKPARLSGGVVQREALGVLEGVEPAYARDYDLVTLADGRRALAIYDEEGEDEWLVGWFD